MERIFISSVQKELAAERQALKQYIQGDALLLRLFDVFLFEDLPASDRRADNVYLDQPSGHMSHKRLIWSASTSKRMPPRIARDQNPHTGDGPSASIPILYWRQTSCREGWDVLRWMYSNRQSQYEHNTKYNR